jgi:S-adenosylmethionine:tRNA ribosyltransferase-isomerase
MFVVGQGGFDHQTVAAFPTLLRGDELLVVNETSVLAARVVGSKVPSGGKIEGLFLKQDVSGHWCMMLKSNGTLRPGTVVEIGCGVTITLLKKNDAVWNCQCSDDRDPQTVLAEIGLTPLPPYIRAARGSSVVEEREDKSSYQTVYADPTKQHSVAAPTAGLHFDEKLLAQLDAKGIERVPVTLHVGAGTFRPVETETVEDHPMHTEWWEVPEATLQAIARAKEAHRPIIAVGTTTVRTLESLPAMDQWPVTGSISRETDLLISPGYAFRFIDGLLTNFHLPNSTLLALVGALIGMDRLMDAYNEAIAQEYRFFSYGDAMFIPPT